MKAIKVQEVKFESAKQFLSSNRELVFSSLRVEFSFLNYDFKTLVNDYFKHIENSRYNLYFTAIMDIKTVGKVIENSVKDFKNTTNYLVNFTAKNDFVEQIRLNAIKNILN